MLITEMDTTHKTTTLGAPYVHQGKTVLIMQQNAAKASKVRFVGFHAFPAHCGDHALATAGMDSTEAQTTPVSKKRKLWVEPRFPICRPLYQPWCWFFLIQQAQLLFLGPWAVHEHHA